MAMKDIDTRLREILWEAKEREISVNEAVDQIKSAFAEEILPKVHKMVELGADIAELSRKNQVMPTTDGLMTGAEWYDRFIQALDDEFHQFSKPTGDEVSVAYDAINVHKAAQRASGLHNKENEK